MSWLFSRALVEEFSAATCSDGEPSAPSSGNPTPHAYLPSDRMTAFSRPSRFGMTFSPLTDDLGAAVLTWCQAASRARTSASPAREQASTASAPACGDTWRGWLARFDPDSSSWRTAQQSLLGDSDESLATFPRWGMTRVGLLWERPTLELPISETGSGLWVPTPIRNDAEKRGNFDPIRSWGPAGFVKLWPTPVAGDVGLRKRPYAQGGTPLSLAATTWPTPVARMWKDNGTSPSELDRNSATLATLAGGSLNPTWVEWLMGWPLGWTDLKPSATDRCHFAPPPPSVTSSQTLSEAA